jgi:hypothetical protein
VLWFSIVTTSGGDEMGDSGYGPMFEQESGDKGWVRICLVMSLIVFALARILVVIRVVLVVVVGLLL